MGQKINPISNRLGIVRGWDSNWFGGKTQCGSQEQNLLRRAQSIDQGEKGARRRTVISGPFPAVTLILKKYK